MAEHADAPASFLRANVAPQDVHSSFGVPRKTGQDAKKSGLARAVASEQRQALARLHLERDVPKRREVAGEFPEMFDCDGRVSHYAWRLSAGACLRYSSTNPIRSIANANVTTRMRRS